MSPKAAEDRELLIRIDERTTHIAKDVEELKQKSISEHKAKQLDQAALMKHEEIMHSPKVATPLSRKQITWIILAILGLLSALGISVPATLGG